MKAGLRFKGKMSMRVIRAHPTLWQRFMDNFQRLLQEKN